MNNEPSMRGLDSWKLATPPEYSWEGPEEHEPPCDPAAECTACDPDCWSLNTLTAHTEDSADWRTR